VNEELTGEPPLSLSQFALGLQPLLFRVAEDAISDLGDRHRGLLLRLEVLQAEASVPVAVRKRGRPPCDRRSILRSFLAKAAWNVSDTVSLRYLLLTDEALRRVCGFTTRAKVPSESTLSRAFGEFAKNGVADRVHAGLVSNMFGSLGEQGIAFEVYRDATDVPSRERVEHKPKIEKPKKKRGRPTRDTPPPEPKRLEKQTTQTLEEMLAELTTGCDTGAKNDSSGRLFFWSGYKFHVDVTEKGLPLSALTTSASLPDCHAAIPLMTLTAQRARSFYQIMDAGYAGPSIVEAAKALDQVAIVKPKATRYAKAVPLDPDRFRRYTHRWQVEQFFSWLKERFGGRNLRVKGHAKAHFHLMCGLLIAFADAALRL
jgi:DDE family transposase/transposase-like protein DUF772